MARVTGRVLGINIIIIQSISEDWQSLYIYSQIPLDLYAFFIYLYPLGWHTLPSPANAEACLTGWPNA